MRTHALILTVVLTLTMPASLLAEEDSRERAEGLATAHRQAREAGNIEDAEVALESLRRMALAGNDDVRAVWFEEVIPLYEQAVVRGAPGNALLTQMTAVADGGGDVERLRTLVGRALAFAHWELTAAEGLARTAPLVEALRALAQRPEASDTLREHLTNVLANATDTRREQGDTETADTLLALLLAEASRPEATTSQNGDLMRAWRDRVYRACRAEDGDAALAWLKKIEARVMARGEGALEPGDALADAYDDWHWYLRSVERGEEAKDALDVLRAFGGRPEASVHQREQLLRALARQHEAAREQDSDGDARLSAEAGRLLTELRRRSDGAGLTRAPLANALRDAYHQADARGRFDRTSVLLEELRTLVAAHPSKDTREHLSIALADAIWSAVERQDGKGLEPLLDTFRSLVDGNTTTAWTRGLLVRVLRYAFQFDGNPARLAEARRRTADDLDNEVALEQLARVLRVLTDKAENEITPAAVSALEEIRQLTVQYPSDELHDVYSTALLDMQYAYLNADRVEDGSALLARLEAQTRRSGASLREHLDLAYALDHRHFFATRRGDRVEAVAALEGMRAVLSREGAPAEERAQLVEALRRELGTLFDASDIAGADRILDEIRARTGRDDVSEPELNELARALALAQARLGDAKDFDRCDSLLAELRTLAARPDASERIIYRLASALGDAMWDIANAERPLRADVVLDEMRSLAGGKAPPEGTPGQLARALTTWMDNRLDADAVGTADDHLREIGVLAENHPDDTRAAVQAARAFRLRHWHAGSNEDHDLAREMLVRCREHAKTAEAREYLAVALSNATWFEGQREHFAQEIELLHELRTLADRLDATMRTRRELAEALMNVHFHLGWADRYDEADAHLAALRRLWHSTGEDAGVLDELAEALSDAAELAFGRRDDPQRGGRIMAELFRRALGPGASEKVRDALALGWDQEHAHATEAGDADTCERVLFQLGTIARRETATSRQRNKLAAVLIREHARITMAGDVADRAALLARMRVIATREDSTDSLREAFAKLLGAEVKSAAERADLEPLRALVLELERLAEREGAPEDIRTQFAVALQFAHRALIDGSPAEAAGYRTRARRRALAANADASQRWQYARMLATAIRAAGPKAAGREALRLDLERLVERATTDREREMLIELQEKVDK